MQPSVQIRPYTATDRDAVERISWQIQEWEQQSYPGRALSKEIITQQVDNLLALVDEGLGVVLVAVLNEQCVGYISGAVHKDYLNTEPSFYVNNMGVDARHRGQGIGSQLLTAIEKTALTKFQLSVMMIGVICGNDGAEKLYRKSGYQPYELTLVKHLQQQ